jgi:hypothetical protein
MEINKLYEIILSYKSQMETRRDEINKYYTSLFAVIISFMPFIDKMTAASGNATKDHNISYILILLSFLGLILSRSWRLALSRIHQYIKGTEEILVQVEKNFEIGFITHMFKYLDSTNSPGRVTKQQMLIPDTFMVTFIIIFAYSIFNILELPLSELYKS